MLHSVGERAVPHGMRSSFRNWSGRTPEISKEVAEAAMSHSQEKVVAAYLTDDFVEERIDVMQLWGDFLTKKTRHKRHSKRKGRNSPEDKIKGCARNHSQTQSRCSSKYGPASRETRKWNDCCHCWANYKTPPSSPNAGHGEPPCPQGQEATHRGSSKALVAARKNTNLVS